MNIVLDKKETLLTVFAEGSVDTVTAPELEEALQKNWDGVLSLVLDFSKVEYISSAGLRVLMVANQHMEETDGNIVVKNVNEDVKEVFEMTGFDTLLNLE